MATSRKPALPTATRKKAAAKAAARNTDSGPANPQPPGDDEAAQRMAEVEAMAAGLPHNPNKAGEHSASSVAEPGATVAPPSRRATGSTLSESNVNAKAGEAARSGANPTTGPLERVRVDGSGQRLTTNQGVPIADNQNSLKAGTRGPVLLEDFILREKITHFDHERIPERIVHARGSAAHGFFECYEALSGLTRAAPFAEAGKITPVFVRFLTAKPRTSRAVSLLPRSPCTVEKRTNTGVILPASAKGAARVSPLSAS